MTRADRSSTRTSPSRTTTPPTDLLVEEVSIDGLCGVY